MKFSALTVVSLAVSTSYVAAFGIPQLYSTRTNVFSTPTLNAIKSSDYDLSTGSLPPSPSPPTPPKKKVEKNKRDKTPTPSEPKEEKVQQSKGEKRDTRASKDKKADKPKQNPKDQKKPDKKDQKKPDKKKPDNKKQDKKKASSSESVPPSSRGVLPPSMPSTSSVTTVPAGIALGLAPLVALPVAALLAGRTALANTKERRETIVREREEFVAKEAKKKLKLPNDIDYTGLVKAGVSVHNIFLFYFYHFLE